LIKYIARPAELQTCSTTTELQTASDSELRASPDAKGRNKFHG